MPGRKSRWGESFIRVGRRAAGHHRSAAVWVGRLIQRIVHTPALTLHAGGECRCNGGMTELLPLMTYCLVMSGTPGPNNMLMVACGAHHGYRRTLPAVLGVNLGVALLTFAACLGL